MKQCIPNGLSLLRVLLCPAVIFFLANSKFSVGFSLFIIACLTDYLDGYAARKLNAISPLGAILDPVSDKIYSLSLFSVLMSMGACPAWFLGLLITVTLLHAVGFVWLKLSNADFVFTPIKLGKWNSALQFIWIGSLLLGLPPALAFLQLLGYLSLAVIQTYVFFGYLLQFRVFLLSDDVVKRFNPTTDPMAVS